MVGELTDSDRLGLLRGLFRNRSAMELDVDASSGGELLRFVGLDSPISRWVIQMHLVL